jgi:uncharacterized protein YdeI (YjbR/CyaY-like superfamily)
MAPRPTILDSYPNILFEERSALRAWLAEHHRTDPGLWVVTWKAATARPRLDAAAICEEALCFGWIDSLPRTVDAERTRLLVTPRKPKSNWSAVNKARADKLIAAGLMTEAGLALIRLAKQTGTWDALNEVDTLVPPADLAAALTAAGPQAAANFAAFPKSVKRGILEWISNAKTPATRTKRVEETARLAQLNQRANQWPRPDVKPA